MIVFARQDSNVQPQAETRAAGLEEPVIVCRDCRAQVTDPSCRIQVDQSFSHTFANPQGHVFEIGCFDRAIGCVPASPACSKFSWFPGYHWKVGVCRNCAVHLGWIFVSDLDHFYGLILDKLIFP